MSEGWLGTFPSMSFCRNPSRGGGTLSICLLRATMDWNSLLRATLAGSCRQMISTAAAQPRRRGRCSTQWRGAANTCIPPFFLKGHISSQRLFMVVLGRDLSMFLKYLWFVPCSLWPWGEWRDRTACNKVASWCQTDNLAATERVSLFSRHTF